MAKSQSHILGEFLGNFLEDALKPRVSAFARKEKLFFDCAGPRKSRRGNKVRWQDVNGNHHDLDFVLERNGSNSRTGDPAAFIELAWRRYTKHSKNKVQEISGAVNPICEKYRHLCPVKAAVLCGVFTATSVNQLRNEGFVVLHIDVDLFERAFQKAGLDIHYDESTSESVFRKMNEALTDRANAKRIAVAKRNLLAFCANGIGSFFEELRHSISRKVTRVLVLPLHGVQSTLSAIDDAIRFIGSYRTLPECHEFQGFEIKVEFANGGFVSGRFPGRNDAIDFLRRLG